ncbi:hypothetical protein EON66_12175, partial [archaeon]
MMHKIAGTSDGRILLAGRDGCVHELVYGGGETGDDGKSVLGAVIGTAGWLASVVSGSAPPAKRARRINHGETHTGYVHSVRTRGWVVKCAHPFHLLTLLPCAELCCVRSRWRSFRQCHLNSRTWWSTMIDA